MAKYLSKRWWVLLVFEELITLLCFFLTGTTIGILFDIFRIIRRSFKTADFITYIEDVCFWCLAGLILLFSIFTFNNGELRLYIFLGILFGALIYLLTISKYFILIFVRLFTFIKKILWYPVNKIIQLSTKIFRPIKTYFAKIHLKIVNEWKKNDKISSKWEGFFEKM